MTVNKEKDIKSPTSRDCLSAILSFLWDQPLYWNGFLATLTGLQ